MGCGVAGGAFTAHRGGVVCVPCGHPPALPELHPGYLPAPACHRPPGQPSPSAATAAAAVAVAVVLLLLLLVLLLVLLNTWCRHAAASVVLIPAFLPVY